MALTLVGIDEAGYGPMLGPLVVARAAVRVERWRPSEPAPDLWSLLGGAVCKAGGDRRGRIAIDDSKKLKGANDGRAPLAKLQRGVLAALAAVGSRPRTDLELFDALGVVIEPQPWYEGPAEVLPGYGEQEAARTGIDANALAVAMEQVGVELLGVSAVAIGERTFNHIVRVERSKAATAGMGVGLHLRAAWEHWGSAQVEGGVRVVCDRQGGRADYRGLIARSLPDVLGQGVAQPGTLTVLEQTDTRSRYRVTGADSQRSMTLLFETESESRYLPIALASMSAKLVRELLMARFNRYWAARAAAAGVELKPTAGYVQDGRRWLADAKGVVSSAERQAMVRIA